MEGLGDGGRRGVPGNESRHARFAHQSPWDRPIGRRARRRFRQSRNRVTKKGETMSHRRVTVSVVQAGSILFDTPRTLDKLASLAADARSSGAQLVLFPEAFVGGYPKGRQFGISLGRRTAEGRQLFQRYFESAISIPGPETDFLASV